MKKQTEPRLSLSEKNQYLVCLFLDYREISYFGTRNKHIPASTLQEIGVLDYGVIRLLMRMLGVTTREPRHTGPVSSSPTCKKKHAQ